MNRAFGAGLLACLTLFFLIAGPCARSHARAGVDLNLVLAVDCSSSVDEQEFDLQIRGTAAAFRAAEIHQAIARGEFGVIAVTLVQWSGADSQFISVPWRRIRDSASARALADEIEGLTRRTDEGSTSISAVITFAADLLAANPARASRAVIDIAGDGANNGGIRVDLARDIAVAQGIVVNGLTILNDVQYLHYYFRNHVIGGSGAFVEIAADYSDFARAIRKKLLREIHANLLF